MQGFDWAAAIFTLLNSLQGNADALLRQLAVGLDFTVICHT
jgi:hypothetical protein